MTPREFHELLEEPMFEIERLLKPLKLGHVLTLVARATTAPNNDGDIVLTKEADIELAITALRRTHANPTLEVPARFSERP